MEYTHKPGLRGTCEACHTAKVKCDREKPSCSRCKKHGSRCLYIPTKRPGRPRKVSSVSSILYEDLVTKRIVQDTTFISTGEGHLLAEDCQVRLLDDATTMTSLLTPDASIYVIPELTEASLSVPLPEQNFGLSKSPSITGVDNFCTIDPSLYAWHDSEDSSSSIQQDNSSENSCSHGRHNLSGHANLQQPHLCNVQNLVPPHFTDTENSMTSDMREFFANCITLKSQGQVKFALGCMQHDNEQERVGQDPFCLCQEALASVMLYRSYAKHAQPDGFLSAYLHVQRVLQWTNDTYIVCQVCTNDELMSYTLVSVAYEIVDAYKQIIESHINLQRKELRQSVQEESESPRQIQTQPEPMTPVSLLEQVRLNLGSMNIEGSAKMVFLCEFMRLKLCQVASIVDDLLSAKAAVAGQTPQAVTILAAPIHNLRTTIVNHIGVIKGMLLTVRHDVNLQDDMHDWSGEFS